MPSPNDRQRNNVRAGVFVSVSILLGVIVLGALTNVIENFKHSTDRYEVTFDVMSGVSNLKAGAEVRVGGMRLGRVLSVNPRTDSAGPLREIDVAFKVDSRVKLYADAVVVVAASLIGSEAWLEIPNVGSTGTPAGNRLKGVASAGALTTLLGAGSAADAQKIVHNVSDLSEFFPTIQDEYQKRLVPTLDNLQAASGDAKAVMNDFREKRYTTWADGVDQVVSWAVKETDRIDGTIAEGKSLFADARTVLAENRESVKSSLANVQSITDRVNTQTIDKVHALLDSGQTGLDQAVTLLENMRVDYNTWATDLGEALGNANLASQQLKLTLIETRRSPWKVLYRPSATELEHELLYEAARSFAVAAGDLKAASGSVERVLNEHGNDLAGNVDAYRRLQATLLNSLSKYEKAQQQLLDVLVSEPASK